MLDTLVVFIAGLVTGPAPGHASRTADSIITDGIEGKVAEELFRHALDLQQAFNSGKTNTKLSSSLQLQLSHNQFFATCGVSGSAVHELATDKLQLRPVGKLSKSGDFFASMDSRWLVKAVSSGEQSKLREFGNVKIQQTLYSDCHGFSHSLLLPIPLTFISQGRSYLVMRNETERLANRTWPEWQVTQTFDIKPLPNLSKQLAALIIALSKGWLGSFVPMSKWEGWDDVDGALWRDCELLTSYNVVDFSLFVNVLQRTSVAHESSPGLSAKDGCITEPSQAAIVCFTILDYLVDFGSSRKLESSWKGDKFQAYGEKLMHALACIGDLNSVGCQAYHDYGSILRAGNTQSKAALLGSETFRKNYECQVERPKLRYATKKVISGRVPVWSTRITDEPVRSIKKDNMFVFSEEFVDLLPEELHSAGWSYNGSGYDASVASWLQDAASLNKGGHVVASGYEQLLEHGLGHPEKGFELHKEELAACKEGIKLFATSSWRGQNNHKDLGNIAWSPRSNSVFVVRGKNKFYSNIDFVTSMRQHHCFMLVRFFRCRASDRKRTTFDYKTSFGSVEVLQVMPSVSSGDDFKVFREMVR